MQASIPASKLEARLKIRAARRKPHVDICPVIGQSLSPPSQPLPTVIKFGILYKPMRTFVPAP